jgi:hypothetical protein
MKYLKFLLLAITLFIFNNILARSEEQGYSFFLKLDSTVLYINNEKNNYFTLEFPADTVFSIEEKIITIGDNITQFNVIPFSEIMPNQKKSISISKVLEGYKKWEFDYQKKFQYGIKSQQQWYFKEDKPFLIWWFKQNKSFDINDFLAKKKNTDYLAKTIYVTHSLCMNFSIYAQKNVAITMSVTEEQNLDDKIEYLKKVANTLRIYGGPVNIDFLMNKETEKYVLRDSLNLLEMKIPEYLNVIQPRYYNMFTASFPEKKEVVNAMSIIWEYKTDSLSFEDFINREKKLSKEKTNYKLIEKNDSTYRYFFTSENDWFHSQNVYLKGENIYCFLNFTATKNTYNYNIEKFEDILNSIKLK